MNTNLRKNTNMIFYENPSGRIRTVKRIRTVGRTDMIILIMTFREYFVNVSDF
jgi:hypothetical protein